MKYVRWYDKNPELKQVFDFIQSLDLESQTKIGRDIIQILMMGFNLNLDEKLNGIVASYNYECKRWYDRNIDLYTSFEIIKSLPVEKQHEIVKKIIQTVLFIYLERIEESEKS